MKGPAVVPVEPVVVALTTVAVVITVVDESAAAVVVVAVVVVVGGLSVVGVSPVLTQTGNMYCYIPILFCFFEKGTTSKKELF